jgi:hypothetical protein
LRHVARELRSIGLMEGFSKSRRTSAPPMIPSGVARLRYTARNARRRRLRIPRKSKEENLKNEEIAVSRVARRVAQTRNAQDLLIRP